MGEWKTVKLGDVLAVLRNGLSCKQNKSGEGQAVSRIETIATGHFNVDRVGYAELSPAQRTKHKLRQGDILFSHINSAPHIGKTAIVDVETDVYHGVKNPAASYGALKGRTLQV